MLRLLFLLFLSIPSSSISAEFEIDPWKPGMSREEVISFTEFGPYTEVEVTGGLETQNGVFNGSKKNISFVFNKNSLDYIQVWFYEGPDWLVAKEKVLEIHELFSTRFEGAQVSKISVKGEPWVDKESLSTVLDKVLGTAYDLGEDARRNDGLAMSMFFDMKPKEQPSNSNLPSRWGYSSRHETFYVFLFQDKKSLPARSFESNISLEKL